MERVATFVRSSVHNNSDHTIQIQSKKIEEYCEAHGYVIVESECVVGDRKTAYPILKRLLHSAKEKGISKAIMVTTNRIVGSAEEVEDVKAAVDASGVTIETLDGSSEKTKPSALLVPTFLAQSSLQADDDSVGTDEGNNFYGDGEVYT